ncbi:biotin carboxylase N-terminal domain-containing protein [Prolixibacter sp. SD074]|uniref:acetyl/propionyl/methylcrotonyl-CoA carboxylase subunit alpha n=1 Tax=Prolixibacter sp. SD074 TaxID=2652391 RepID=UPI0012866B48|nr:biotin carboxylase N-terminal domain-containing protein [Prolixibacter sp. SD074]GET29098.1 3-methylcrotonyl-CoA carboxylase subunit alpha [Prolixibacter sp. SD074]
MMERLEKILIANRGEIALRIIRAARSMHISAVAVYSEGEAGALHVRQADGSVSLGEGSLNDTYLNIEKMIQVAVQSGAQAIHPGYGFLSEDYRFAEACAEAGIIFIGPDAEVLRLMGNKMEAKLFAQKLGIPVLFGQTLVAGQLNGEPQTLEYPLLIKASHGGGGKGIQIVGSADELNEKLTQASRAAANYFGNGEVYIEPYIEKARHIEVQILGDSHGNLVHLFERDCTLQRNHQKILEEAPAANLPASVQKKLLDAALLLGKRTNYSGAGTVEFLVEPDGRFWFMEMNPRIQVEHPVTEEATGVDIVREQLRIASGRPLSFRQSDVSLKGHSIEVRVYREDPEKAFAPSSVPVHFYRLPGNGVRLETDLDGDNVAGSLFDPLIAKIITFGESRNDALAKMQLALDELTVHGPKTNLLYLKYLLKEPSFANNNIHTAYCGEQLEEHLDGLQQGRENISREVLLAAYLYLGFLRKQNNAADTWEQVGFLRLKNEVEIAVDGQMFSVAFHSREGNSFQLQTGAKMRMVSVKETEDQWLTVSLGGKNHVISWSNHPVAGKWLDADGFHFHVTSPDLLEDYYGEAAGEEPETAENEAVVRSPLHGKIIDIQVKHKQTIKKGEVLLVIESMKSENHVTSPRAAKIKSIAVEVGSQVTDEMPLIILEDI